jgi:hypothetical protein
MYTLAMNSTNEWREERREEAEEEAKYGERPDHISEEEWDLLEGPVKKRAANGTVDESELRRHIERQKRKQEEDTHD